MKTTTILIGLVALAGAGLLIAKQVKAKEEEEYLPVPDTDIPHIPTPEEREEYPEEEVPEPEPEPEKRLIWIVWWLKGGVKYSQKHLTKVKAQAHYSKLKAMGYDVHLTYRVE